ncbi:MAG: glutathione S-transferase N-terminal domain-containing protein [Burkholderiales bacterium]|jgi:glutathione S-transferase|nr:glutathione S-transferase N-terminal domain-containing protein [Burkholderiales bacterium]MCA3162214.1 glutathione S-transferase N-terminal domain-containing protein [Burkholderiales bacterium]MCA3165538.1 glutathione S-transferase N-terminal domain-containing protein [Burkholderiales bacterium]MCA3171151.1 glutathione S-transferase N-terminal domain-containing protein [Burkholderiales bacterium]MCA3172672.1 glutathione S-transferase N-terminal domain-containing protein [Burkholderiales bact
MKLIGSHSSPYARKVRIVLAEKKLDYQFVLEDVWSPNTGIKEFNPLGKVPCLIMDDGGAVFDSRVICEYLDGLSPNARLIPQDSRARIAVKTWEALADGLCDAAIAVRLESQRAADRQDPMSISRQMEKMDSALEAISKGLGDNPWCVGVNMTLADIAVGAALAYLDFRFPHIAWREQHPNLLRLQEKLEKRPSFIDTAPVKV